MRGESDGDRVGWNKRNESPRRRRPARGLEGGREKGKRGRKEEGELGACAYVERRTSLFDSLPPTGSPGLRLSRSRCRGFTGTGSASSDWWAGSQVRVGGGGVVNRSHWSAEPTGELTRTGSGATSRERGSRSSSARAHGKNDIASRARPRKKLPGGISPYLQGYCCLLHANTPRRNTPDTLRARAEGTRFFFFSSSSSLSFFFPFFLFAFLEPGENSRWLDSGAEGRDTASRRGDDN